MAVRVAGRQETTSGWRSVPLAFRVLFVCSGNTCRSPMAEALLKDRILRDPDLRSLGVEVGSAGLDRAGRRAGGGRGGPGAEIPGHRAGGAPDPPLWRRSSGVRPHSHHDGESQVQDSLAHPEAAAKVYTLKEYARLDGPSDIADPFMQGDEAYRSALEEIGRAVEALAGRLKEQLAGAEEAKRGESES